MLVSLFVWIQQSKAPRNGSKCHSYSCRVNLSQKTVHLKESLGSSVQSSWGKLHVGSAALCPIPGRARRPSSRTNCIPKSWSHQPARSPETWCGCGHCCCGWGSRRGGRQQLLLLAAVTDGHLLCMVASECLIYGLTKRSVGHVKAAHMVEALPSIYRTLYS